jgi:large subunit ribosomal protein L23
MKDPRDIIISPVVSEKSYDMIEKGNTYTFVVDRRSNKIEIKEAFEEN